MTKATYGQSLACLWFLRESLAADSQSRKLGDHASPTYRKQRVNWSRVRT